MPDFLAPPTDPVARTTALHTGLDGAPARLFQFDPRLAEGWLSDRYFLRTAATLAHAGRDPVVTMQVFAKEHGVVCGLHECLRLIETCLADGYTRADVTVQTLLEGDAVAPLEAVLWITGPYRAFAHLETPLIGILARRTLVASNVRRVVSAAAGRPVIYMGARHDDWRVQTADGYAARVGGVGSVSSHAGGAWWGEQGVGTMPHAMIAAFDGDTVAATRAFARYVRDREPGVQIVSLVDYHNDVVGTSLAVARAMAAEFGPGALGAVRLDTSEKLVDVSLLSDADSWGVEAPTGVTPRLVRLVRSALDAEGFTGVGIVVSGGFTPHKIARFERAGVPVSAYGVGSSLLGHSRGESDGLLTGFDFTADLVTVNGRPQSKIGRAARPNPRHVTLDWSRLNA